jgi:hypothetical protein
LNKIKKMNPASNEITAKQGENQNLSTLFPIEGKKVELNFEGEQISSDGGLLLLKEVEKQVGIISALSMCITDERDKRHVQHTLNQMLAQRIFQIMAGYEDANDCNPLKDDPIFKLCADKLPETQSDLASQPTMSRFENSVTRTDLYRIGECFANSFIRSYVHEPEVIILDCDDTNTDVHGHQQLSLFNDYYGEYCFMPLHIYEGLSGKLITTILKPGRRSKGIDVFGILYRVIRYIRRYWKRVRIIVRGDSHFCSVDMMDWAAEQEKVNFITGLTANQKLNQLSETTLKSAQKMWESTKKPVKIYHTFSYKAGSWKTEQRVIVKVEVNANGTNIRYIVTDLWKYRTKELYEKGYCGRGRMELCIKEHKTYLHSDRSSCNRFESNQFRLFMHSAAYILLHTLKNEVLKGTEFCRASIKTIQLKLIKVAAHVKELKTKIKIEMPRTTAEKEILEKCFAMFEIIRC